MRLLYNFFWILILPFITLGFLLHSRGRLRIKERFGLHNHSLSDIKILAHGASVGEVLSLMPILSSFGINFDKVLLTGTSVTGLIEGEKRGLKNTLLLPIDLLFFYKKAFSDMKPEACIISESDVWPAMISYFSKNSKIIYVNGRFRFSILKKYSPLYVSSLKKVTLFLVENQKSKDSLLSYGVSLEKIKIMGNAKYDVEALQSSSTDYQQRLRENGSLIITLGSVRPEELGLFSKLFASSKYIRVIIAPRHLEHLEKYKKFLEPFGYGVCSQKNFNKVLLLDTFGELKSYYAASDIIIVGGSFVPGIGGHNPLEGAPSMTPTCIGKYAYKVQDIVDDLLQSDGIMVLPSDESEIFNKISKLLNDKTKRMSLGQNLNQYWRSISGSGEKQGKEIKTYLLGQNL